MLAGLTAGVGAWAALGKKEEVPPFGEDDKGTGPRSSPGLTPAQEEAAARGRSVPLSDSAQALREVLTKAPESVQGRVVPPHAPRTEKSRKSKRPLKVTYNADQIIGRASKHAHHRRALANADMLVEKQKGEQALEILERVKQRVPDEEIQKKIDTNIEDIRRWLEGLDFPEEEGLAFPEIIIPLTTQAIAIEQLTEGLKAVSQGLAAQISYAYQAFQTLPAGAPGLPGPGTPSGSPTVGGAPVAIPVPVGHAAPGGAPGTPTTGTPGTGAGAPLVVPVPIYVGQPSGPMTGASPTTGGPAIGGGPMTGSGPDMGGLRVALGPGSTIQGPGMGEAVPIGYGMAQPAAPQTSWVPDGIKVGGDGEVITDGWNDADFEREWEKYKNLPLKDRRSGKDRRTGFERRKGPDALRKDRRSGVERRKKDLFKERDEFLKKLAKHKEAKARLEDAKKKLGMEGKPAPGQPMFQEPQLRIENATIKIGEFEKPEEERPPVRAEPEPEAKKPEPEPEKKDEGKPEPTRVEQVYEDLSRLGFPSAIHQEIEPVVVGGEPMGAEPEAPAKAEAAATEAGESGLGEGVEEISEPEEIKEEKEKPPVQEIHGILELKPPEEDDAPFLTLTYDFTKIPDSFKLSRDYHTMEYAYYKYKPMLIKAQEFTRRKMLKNALNYYRVIKSQNIPPEFKRMVNRNIKDITDYLEKFLMSRG